MVSLRQKKRDLVVCLMSDPCAMLMRKRRQRKSDYAKQQEEEVIKRMSEIMEKEIID